MDCIMGYGLFPNSQYLDPSENFLEREVLVMDRLGPSMGQLFRLCDKHVPVDTIVPFMKQMVLRMKEIHASGYLHKDIKPDNFCLGGPELRDLYLIDFGLSRKWADENGL